MFWEPMVYGAGLDLRWWRSKAGLRELGRADSGADFLVATRSINFVSSLCLTGKPRHTGILYKGSIKFQCTARGRLLQVKDVHGGCFESKICRITRVMSSVRRLAPVTSQTGIYRISTKGMLRRLSYVSRLVLHDIYCDVFPLIGRYRTAI